MLDPTALAFGLFVIFMAGAIQAMTGFGFGLVAIPLLTLFISPKVAPPIVLIDGIILNMLILRGSYKLVELRRIWVLMLGGVLGVPLGTWILANWDVQSLRIYIGVVTIIVAAVFLAGLRAQVQREKTVMLPIGFFSGILSGSVNMAGPPVILFFANQDMPRPIFRANIVSYFFTLQLCAIPFLLRNGILDAESAGAGFVLLPGLFIGALVGTMLVSKVPDQLVRRLTLVIVTLAGLLSILSGFEVI